jgi:hypothetical protein
MYSIIRLCALALVLTSSAVALAQTAVRTETIRPPGASLPAPDASAVPPRDARVDLSAGQRDPLPAVPEIMTDLSRLPAAVARTRERILAAARNGDLQQVAALMQEAPAVFSFSDDKDPIAFWRANYPDSGGLEVLSILTTILDSGFVRLDAGTAQEIYVWPYFVQVPLKTLTPQQKVELFRIMTGADYKEMLAYGAYAFYRVGIGADGRLHFFVSGD